MKTIVAIAGYIIVGHIAVKADGLTSIELTEAQSKITFLSHHPRGCRLVSHKEFASLIGSDLLKGMKIVKPYYLPLKKAPKAEVLDLITK